MKDKEINNKIAFLKKAITNDKLVIFAGSGVSVDSGLPIWKDLLRGIRTNLNFDARNEHDALKIAQLLFNEKGEKEYYEIVKNLIFCNSKNKPNPLHELIFQLNPQHIVTTNYVNFFEQIIDDEGLPFSVVAKDADLPYAKHKSLLIKYHGDFENHNIVLKETDYLEFSKLHTLKEIFVKALFSNKIILFVGYSFSDINLKLLSREVQYILKKHHQRAYLINLEDTVSESEKNYYENLGINIINYGQAEKEISNLGSYIYRDNNTLSDATSKAYQLLNYINSFHSSANIASLGDTSEDDAIDELFDCFSKFTYFRILPKDFLANLYPLRKNSRNYYVQNNIVNDVFICFNQPLFDILNRFQGDDDQTFNKEQRDKIIYCLKRFRFSGVFYIAKPTESPDSMGYTSYSEDDIISIDSKIKQSAKCECISCTLNEYKYADVVRKIDKYNISHSSDLFEDLQYANTLCRLHYNFKAYNAFRKIYHKANKLKVHDVSFVAKYNMYWLGKNSNFLYENGVERTEYDLIRKETENTDLDKELQRVKYFIHEDVYELLREIRSGIYLQRLCDDIDENYQKIPETKRLVEKGGASSNNDINNLYKSITKLEHFRELNFINGNGYSRIYGAIRKSINAFVVAYSMKFVETNPHHHFSTPHLTHYNSYLLRLIIEYGETEKLKAFLTENKLDNIAINDDEIYSVCSNISNFLSSVSEANSFTRKNDPNKMMVAKILGDYNFRLLIMKQFDNICLILAYFELPTNKLNELYDKLNDFIQFVKFDSGREYHPLTTLLLKKYRLLDTEKIKSTLEIYHENGVYNDVYERILEALKAKDKNFHTALFQVDRYKLRSNSNYYIIPPCLEVGIKNKFLSQVNNFLISDQADIVDMFLCLHHNIAVNQAAKKNYIEKVKAILSTYHNETGIYNGYRDYDLINFFLLIYNKKISKKVLEGINIRDKYFQFLFELDKFPETEFKVEWLTNIHYKQYFKKFKHVPYILPRLESHLQTHENVDLMKIYFKLKREL